MDQDKDLEKQELEPGEEIIRAERERKSIFGKGFLAGALVCAVILSLVFVIIPGIVRQSYRLKTAQEQVEQQEEVADVETEELLDEYTIAKLEILSEKLQEEYYGDLKIEDLREGLYKGLFEYTDKYTTYFTAEEFATYNDNKLNGSFAGIGAQLQQDDETMLVYITHVYEDSPAEKAGLQDGDIIYKVEEYEGSSMELSELITHIRGEIGTTVHMEIFRGGGSFEVDITREEIPLKTVSAQMMDNHTGYISVVEFAKVTAEQFSDALQDMQKQGAEKLIIDLRANPGGMLTSVTEMLDEILPEGLLVYTEDRAGKRVEYCSTDEKSLDMPIVVLVDGRSASASEIFAGAMQDRGAATIVGTTTYGKGVVQNVHGLQDGSAFQATVQAYYTPKGVCIQGIGIRPDEEVPYEFLGGENDVYSLEFDSQVQRAFEILNP